MSNLQQLSEFITYSEQMRFVIKLGKTGNHSIRQEQYKIDACSYAVWVKVTQNSQQLYIETDSDSVIFAGVLLLFAESVSRCGDSFELDNWIKHYTLSKIVTDSRKQGLQTILQYIFNNKT